MYVHVEMLSKYELRSVTV